MKKNIIFLCFVLALHSLYFNTCAKEDTFVFTQENNNIVIEGTLLSIPGNSNIGIVILDDDKPITDFENVSGDITNDSVFVKQLKLSEDNRFVISIPVNNKLPYGKVNVYIGSQYKENYIETSFYITKLTCMGNDKGICSLNGEYKILRGRDITISFTPHNNNILRYVKLNNNKVIENRSGITTYKIENIYNDTFVLYEFAAPEPYITDALGPYPKINLFDLRNNMSDEDREFAKDKVGALLFAKSVPCPESYRIKEAGFLFSDSYINLTESKNVKKIKANKISGDGSYGVLFLGEPIKKNIIYYALSYVTYVNDGGTITVYGKTKNFYLDDFSKDTNMNNIFIDNLLNTKGIRVYLFN